MKIEIKHRFTGTVLYSGDHETLKGATVAAIKSDAYLGGADLGDADLGGADLGGADLRGAYLRGAKNVPAALASHEDPKEPYVRRPSKTPAERMARARQRHPEVPIVEDLDRKILEASEQGALLNMSQWHCGTSHCRAGWATTLAGQAGADLERRLGPLQAGRLIYLVSTGRSPHFFATNEAALSDMRKCAGEALCVP